MSVPPAGLAGIENAAGASRGYNTDSIRAQMSNRVLRVYSGSDEQFRQKYEMADIRLSQDGKSYIITPKYDVSVEVLKKTFGIEDGAFRERLKTDYENGMDNGVFVQPCKKWFGLANGTRYNYTRALLYNDQSYTIPIESFCTNSGK